MTTPPPPPPGSDPYQQPTQQGYPPQQGYQQGLPQSQHPDQQYPPEHPQPGYRQQSHGHGAPHTVSGQRLGSSEERTWSILAHLSPFLGWLLSAGFLTFLGPLLIWAFYRERSAMVRTAAAGAFNFNITILIVNVVGVVFAVVTLGIGLLVVIPVLLATFVIALVLHIQAALKASRGETYTYPLQVPILR